MTEAQDLFARLGFDKSAPPPPPPAVDLTGYLIDLSVRRLSPAEMAKRRAEGVYRNIRAQDLVGYPRMRGGA